MGFSLCLSQSLSFFLFLFHFHSTISSPLSLNYSSSSSHLCAHHQSLSLLQFKQSFSINSSASSEYYCQYPFPKTESWIEGTDCCFWDGVTCDLKTGHVTGLDLSCSMLYGTLRPNNSLFSLHNLQQLDLSFNDFNTSHISSRFGHFSSLTHLNLSGSDLAGQVPLEVSHLSKLVSLDLSSNYGLSLEPICFDKLVRNLTKLRELYLSWVNMSLVVPDSLMNLSSSLSSLKLKDCRLQGKFPSSMGRFKHLRYLDLGGNSLTGSIPYDFEQLTELVSLSLSGNFYLSLEPISFDKIVQNLTKLREVNSAFGKFPGNIFLLPNLESLYLSSNEGLTGSFPSSNLSSISEFQHDSLVYLYLSNNYLHGTIPSSIFKQENLEALLLVSNSKLTGEISSSICKLRFLEVLDLSDNSLSGSIPLCLGNFSSKLSVLHLGMNNLQGTIPSTFSKGNSLEYLDLNGNELEGEISPSIINCTMLEVLDLGNNKIEDTFPYFLEMLPKLQILVLKSNKLQGFVKGPTAYNSFLKLWIFDISGNNFSRPLPTRYFNTLEAMMTSDKNMTYLNTTNHIVYVHSIEMTWKGVEIEFLRIRSTIRILDLSSNSFTGEIPKVIGKLKALQQLNLSHNFLTGHIQSSLGNLTNLESLDLSSNLLTGRIPMQMAYLTFLSTLNLSHNQLEGPIPSGKQFNTFDARSFEGNSGLCGFQVLKECYGDEAPSLPPSSFDEGDDSTLFGEGFGWKAVTMGYGCGFVFGVATGYVVCRTKKPSWFLRMVEDKWNLKSKNTKKNFRRYGARRN
ncbi:receptor-like protein 9DC3 [Populus alba x Populus x berolinensis]|nr:receptor-like protein 9DC3 [Populus alba x Populus x berolinensis]